MKHLLLVVVCLIVATEALAQQPARSNYGLPPGFWGVSCGPRLKQRGPYSGFVQGRVFGVDWNNRR